MEDEKEEIMEWNGVQKKFTVKRLANVFFKVNAAILELKAMNPNVEQFGKVER